MELICIALTVYSVVLLIRIILSWVTMFSSPSPALSPAIRVIYDLTEPILGFMRRYVPSVGGLDLSPLIIFFIIRFVQAGLGCG